MDISPTFLLYIPVLLFSFSVHEAAHALAAKIGGDPGPEQEGRLSLNPKTHIDPIGTVVLPLILFFTSNTLFGWARPVMVNDRLLRPPIWRLWVSLAGPASNLLILLIAVLLMKAGIALGGDAALASFEDAISQKGTGLSGTLMTLGWIFIKLNLLLAIFNMLPIPPLDGSRIVYHYFIQGTANQNVWHTWNFLNQFGFILLFMLFTLPGVQKLFSVIYLTPLIQIVRFLGL